MMIQQSQEYTKLLELVTCHLLQSPQTCSQLESKIHYQRLFFNVIGKQSSLYLTDLLSSIQVQYKNKNLCQTSVALSRNPINKFVTSYYEIKDKRWHPFNFRTEILQQEKIQYQCPYQPSFYFKESYPQFIVEKKKKNLHALNCTRIIITKWRWKIVNINATGWYAPIIEAITYKLEQNTIREQFYEVSCILYEKQVRLCMERLRLQEMRQKDISKLPHQSNSISMLYYLKDAQEPLANKRFNNIFKTDASKQMLDYNSKQNMKYVLFGQNDQGILTLAEKMSAQAIQLDKLKNLNLQNLKILFNSNPTGKPTTSEDAELWSSSDQASDHQQGPIPIIDMINQSSEESEDQDPLRDLYIRKFNHLCNSK